MRVLFTPKCERDILKIVEYCESRGVSSTWFRRGLAEAVAHLEAHPDTAVRRRDLTRRDVLFWLMGPYWLVLKRTNDVLFVVTVSHCSRKLGPLIHESLKASDE